MDIVINVVPDAGISKIHKITFQLYQKYKNINFCIPKFCQDIMTYGKRI